MEDNTKYVIHKSFISLLIPTTISNISIVVVSLINAILFTKYNGTYGLTVASLSIPLLALWGCLYEGLGTGASTLFAQSIGERNFDKCKQIVARSNTLTLIVAVVIAVLGVIACLLITPEMIGIDEPLFSNIKAYGWIMFISSVPIIFNNYLLFLVRADSAQRVAAISAITQGVLNIILDVVFMGVLGLGIMGAGIALLLASIIALVITLIHVMSKKSSFKLIFTWPEMSFLKKIVPFSMNSITDNISDFIMSLIVNVSVLVVLGIKLAAIFYIINYLLMFVMYLSMGFTYSASPIISVYFGEKNNKALDLIAKLSFSYVTMAGVVVSVLLFVFARPIGVDLFNYEYTELYNTCTWAIRLYALSVPFYMLNMMMITYTQILEKFRLSLFIIVGNYAMLALIMVLMVSAGKYDSFWWSFFIANVVTCVGWFLYVHKEKKRHGYESLLCLTQHASPFKAEVYYLILPDKFDQVADYQDMLELFLRTHDVEDGIKYKAGLAMEEFMNFASETKCSSKSYISIRIGVTYNNTVSLSSKVDSGTVDLDTILKMDPFKEENIYSLRVLRGIASSFRYNRILSLNHIDLSIDQ